MLIECQAIEMGSEAKNSRRLAAAGAMANTFRGPLAPGSYGLFYPSSQPPEDNAMTQPNPGEKIPLTVYLSPEVAKRLKAAEAAQKRPAADLAADLLDRYLPRLPTAGQQKGSIPYS